MVLSLLRVFDANCQTDTSGYIYQKPLFNFSYDKTVFKLQNEQLSNKRKFLRASVLTGYREGVKPVSGIVNFSARTDSITGTRIITIFNLSIEDLLVHNTSWSPPNKVILEVKDPSKYRYDPKYGSKDIWIRKNTYCYEYIMPNGTMRLGVPNTFMGMQFEEDLQQLFGVRVSREKREVKLPGKEGMVMQDFVVIREVK